MKKINCAKLKAIMKERNITLNSLVSLTGKGSKELNYFTLSRRLSEETYTCQQDTFKRIMEALNTSYDRVKENDILE